MYSRLAIFVASLSCFCGLPAAAQDGPYVVCGDDGRVALIRFDKDLNMSARYFDGREDVGTFTVRTQEGGYAFSLRLHEAAAPPVRYDMPERMVVVSDPHGDFVPFAAVLQGAGVVDERLEWRFGRGHLVVLGDIFDRGDDVTAIYWLTYTLEEQARQAGGAVHFLIGNHEVMIAQNDLRYISSKYRSVAGKAGKGYGELWDGQTELGRWILMRNQMEVIGDVLFVHAGVSPQVAAAGLGIEQINDTVRKYMALGRNAAASSPVAEIVMRTNGPLWYRGLVRPNEEMTAAVLDGILARFGVKRIIVGHTVLPEVSAFFDVKVINVNVNNQKNMERAASRGVMITPDDVWAIDGNGNRMELARP